MGLFSQKQQPDDAAEWLRRGQCAEAGGTPAALDQAIHCYDRSITLLKTGNVTTARALAIGWMNRGNALQKLSEPDRVHEAVAAYDTAISLLQSRSASGDAEITNSLGAAWLNRGHALHQLPDADSHVEAAHSFAQAVTVFSSLPVASSLVYQLNLAGAQMNLAHALPDTDAPNRRREAYAAAESALQLTARHELTRAGFAEIGLKARRVLCEIIGESLVACDEAKPQENLIATAGDVIDGGMTLARRWEALGVPVFRPIATRLFRFGTAFYRRHQPHFLADFVLENLHSTNTDAGASVETEWMNIAREALAAAREDLRTLHPMLAGHPATERQLQALQDIESALARLPDLSACPATKRPAPDLHSSFVA